ncbi:MAG TPA: type II secretion system protein GspG [Polyangia bacterium]|jgi:Type II secretory pathway, pseudopilin PulG|nr:type II secretion system protein GspG [Polyangia bacterium]
MTDDLENPTEASVGKRASPTRRRSGDSGMTLMEIMIVFALIALIMGAVGVGAFNYFKKGQVKTARIQVNEIMQKAQQYMMDNNNECPKTMDDLVAQKYMPRRQKDPWNKDFIMRCPGQINTDGIDVISIGPDGTEGTADDIKAQE